MSGEKCQRVILRETEYNRVNNSTTRRDNFKANVNSQLEELRLEQRRLLNDRMASIQQRHEHYERALSGLGEEIQAIEREQNRKMREHAQHFQKELGSLQEQVQDQRREYLHLIRQQSDKFTLALENQKKELQKQINDVNERLNRKEASEKEQALIWLQAVEQILNHIRRHYQHEKFRPGVLERLNRELELIRDNNKMKIYPAVIASGQQAFLNASDLRVDLEKLEREWEANLEVARQSAAEVMASCEAQKECRFTLQTEEGPMELDGEIDFWTGGALAKLTKTAEKELARLREPAGLTLSDLQSSIQESQERLGVCEDLSEKARQAIIASQVRQNIAQAVAGSLHTAGWEVTDSTYESEDFSRSIHVKLGNLQGDEIVTVITPEAEMESAIQNTLNIFFFDRSTNDEMLRRERIRLIMERLKELGLDGGEATCTPGTEQSPATDISKLDLDRVRRQSSTKQTAVKRDKGSRGGV